MSRPKHSARTAAYSRQRLLLFAVTAILLLTTSVGAVFAYLKLADGAVNNTFKVATPPQPAVSETFDSVVKKNVAVAVGNPGYAVYVRAAIVVTWKDASGKVLAEAPSETVDYSLVLNTTDWFYHDGFYYYTSALSSGNTASLIQECKVLTEAPTTGYTLSVEIVAQTIQALGMTDDGAEYAVQNAWKVKVNDDGTLSTPT